MLQSVIARSPAACTVIVLLLMLVSKAAIAERAMVETRSGVSVGYELNIPDGAKAVVLLYEGGGGKINNDPAGFAQIAHGLFHKQGIASALVAPPSDQSNFMGGMHPRFRASREHMMDIGKTIQKVKQDTGLPVWLLGVSLGTRSVAAYATRMPDTVEGLILVSSSTSPKRGKGIQDMPFPNVRVPVLAVAHSKDRCQGTPPSGAKLIANAASNSVYAESVVLEGGRNKGKDPCGIQTYHTFFAMEKQAVEEISRFILKFIGSQD